MSLALWDYFQTPGVLRNATKEFEQFPVGCSAQSEEKWKVEKKWKNNSINNKEQVFAGAQSQQKKRKKKSFWIWKSRPWEVGKMDVPDSKVQKD